MEPKKLWHITLPVRFRKPFNQFRKRLTDLGLDDVSETQLLIWIIENWIESKKKQKNT